MTSFGLEEWRALFTQVEVIGTPSSLSEKQLLDFESRVRVTLPSSYKDFCRVFGTGEFSGKMFYIQCPNPEKVEGLLMSDSDIITACKSAYKYPSEVQELLDSAYVFGSGQGYVLFFFDLRTYSELDKSYDIYGIGDGITYVYKLGREFFEFVRDFCLGNRTDTEFPELLEGVPTEHRENPRYFRKTFVAYGSNEER